TLKRPVLNLPQMCQLPREPDVKRDKPDSWSKKGIGVVVLDSTSGAPLYRLKLSAVLAEGSKRDAGSSGGVSVIPLFGKEKPVALALTAIRGQVETVDLPTDAVPGRIHRVLVDAARLVPPFFNELRLEIEGNALVWQETGGRYQH
ncbi:MAG: hypothetical protein OEL57_14065, partial [Trichlorobacter sp.]|uniref:hypothetical protein n=1 Tax=Trichlorobacter sp. TaxID=2911007 RepID=UPI00256E5AD2